MKSSSLLLEHSKEGFEVIAPTDLGGERVVSEIFTRLLDVLLQGGIIEGLEVRASGGSIACGGHRIMGEMLDIASGEDAR
jgi:hypothetical protein